MSVRFLVHEYENNPTNKLVKIDLNQFIEMVVGFDREQEEVLNAAGRYEYAVMHRIESIKQMFQTFCVDAVIHQDSERDIYLVN